MPTGDNKVIINLTTELKIHMDKRKGDLERSFYLALDYLKNHKDELIAEWGQDAYDAHVKRYSRTAIELKNASAKRKKEAIEQKRRELDIREKELEVKTRFLNAETQAMNDTHTEKTEAERKKLSVKNAEQIKQVENDLRIAHQQLEEAKQKGDTGLIEFLSNAIAESENRKRALFGEST